MEVDVDTKNSSTVCIIHLMSSNFCRKYQLKVMITGRYTFLVLGRFLQFDLNGNTDISSIKLNYKI